MITTFATLVAVASNQAGAALGRQGRRRHREYNLIVRDVLFGFTPSLSPLAGFHTWTTLLCSSRPTFSTFFILFNPSFYSSLHSSGTMFLKSALVSLLLLTPWMFVRGTSLNTHF